MLLITNIYGRGLVIPTFYYFIVAGRISHLICRVCVMNGVKVFKFSLEKRCVIKYYCPVKLLKRKKLRAESICGFSPNCYLCFRHKSNR